MVSSSNLLMVYRSSRNTSYPDCRPTATPVQTRKDPFPIRVAPRERVAARPARFEGMRSRLPAYAALSPLLILLALWLWAFYQEGAFRGGPSGKAFGADY